jgi:ABC-type nitrate/sulfonate/bicarbonate transport system permease component
LTPNRTKHVSWAIIALWLAIWFAVTESGLVKPFRLPKPAEVVQAAFDVRNDIVQHTLATVARLLIGYTLGVTVGVLGGLLLRALPRLNNAIYPIIESWRPVPTVALVPFFLVWFGFAELGKILLIVLGVALIIIVSTYEAIGNIKPVFVRAAFALGATKSQMFRTVIIPGMLPELRSGLRISIAAGFGLVIVSELMGAEYGLGQLIDIARRTFSSQTILLAILLIGGIAVLLDKIIQFTIDSLTGWSVSSRTVINLRDT